MALTNAYLQTTKNLHSIINSVISAKAPERFTNIWGLRVRMIGYISAFSRR